ncbi:hypothetical protein B0O80DRAFT_461462 [Mortierella sp. GBAus27b]|nr:hypothetical protein B0O80DRAFT_461462 [Mortierella sp. GBAus27b]
MVYICVELNCKSAFWVHCQHGTHDDERQHGRQQSVGHRAWALRVCLFVFFSGCIVEWVDFLFSLQGGGPAPKPCSGKRRFNLLLALVSGLLLHVSHHPYSGYDRACCLSNLLARTVSCPALFRSRHPRGRGGRPRRRQWCCWTTSSGSGAVSLDRHIYYSSSEGRLGVGTASRVNLPSGWPTRVPVLLLLSVWLQIIVQMGTVLISIVVRSFARFCSSVKPLGWHNLSRAARGRLIVLIHRPAGLSLSFLCSPSRSLEHFALIHLFHSHIPLFLLLTLSSTFSTYQPCLALPPLPTPTRLFPRSFPRLVSFFVILLCQSSSLTWLLTRPLPLPFSPCRRFPFCFPVLAPEHLR